MAAVFDRNALIWFKTTTQTSQKIYLWYIQILFSLRVILCIFKYIRNYASLSLRAVIYMQEVVVFS